MLTDWKKSVGGPVKHPRQHGNLIPVLIYMAWIGIPAQSKETMRGLVISVFVSQPSNIQAQETIFT